MAIDESILHHVATGKSPPTIRFYQWSTPGAISLAYSQNIADVDSSIVPLVRRPTGGRAVFHGKNDFTYSVIVPEKEYPEFLESYFLICQWLVFGLKSLDIEASFDNSTSLLANGKKISGNAQVRKNGTILQHGTVFYMIDRELLPKIFRIPPEKRNAFLEKIVSVSELSPADVTKMFSAFERSFSEGKNILPGELTDGEKAYAKNLLAEKYATKAWTHGTSEEAKKGDCHSQWEDLPEREVLSKRFIRQ